MKRFAAVLSVALLSYSVSQAQNTIIAGKITDKKGNTIPHATVQLASKTDVVEIKADNLGLYQTQPLPSGKYKVTVRSGDRNWKKGKLILADNNGKKAFYEMHAKGKRVKVEQTDRDFFTEARMTQGPDIQQRPGIQVKQVRSMNNSPANGPVQHNNARAGEAVPQMDVK
jgi:hypothetical protein